MKDRHNLPIENPFSLAKINQKESQILSRIALPPPWQIVVIITIITTTLSKAEASVLKFILTFDVITVCEDTFKLMTRLGDEGTMKADWLQFLES